MLRLKRILRSVVGALLDVVSDISLEAFARGGALCLFAGRRIPANPHISGNGFQDVHATHGDDRNLHCACINIDDADAFLPSAVQGAHADRERLGGL
jgi:hypothetical protein